MKMFKLIYDFFIESIMDFILVFKRPKELYHIYTHYLVSVEGIVILHIETGKIVYCNAAFAKYLGYRIREIQGTPWQQLAFSQDVAPAEEFESQHGRVGLMFYDYRMRYVHKNGELKRLSWSGIPKGDFYYYTAILLDP